MGFLKVKNLSCSYSDGTVGIRNISFTLNKNQRMAVIGANGAGKTTLLLALAGLIPFAGEVRFDGILLTRKTAPEIRKRLGFVFQDPDDQIFMPTVFEDVAFSLRNAGIKGDELKYRTLKALATVGLPLEFLSREPHHLSFGEKRRVCIAGALVHEPELLLLDEPTSGLDPRSRRELLGTLHNLTSTIIIATHDLDAAGKICDVVLLLKKGHQVALGTKEEVLEDKKLLEHCGLL